MTATLKPFSFAQDFLRVRDFLSQTFHAYQRSVNWRIERWEYAFHFIVPYFSNWDGQPPSEALVEETQRLMESLTGLWETETGEVAGLVNIEHPEPKHPDFGEFFIQQHPDHPNLLPEMLDFAEARLFDPGKNRLFIFANQGDRQLQELLEERGFATDPVQTAVESQLTLNSSLLPETPSLPDGFRVQAMADDNDLLKRCKAFGRGFNHMDPVDWPSVIAYEHLQRAPDYHKDQDIVIVSPEGEFASFCLIWLDLPNNLAVLEPVGTQPEFRKMGLAREAIYEAMRRAAAKGADRVMVGSAAPFYRKIGFEPVETRILTFKHFG